MMNIRQNKGFTLIELMIVVAVIAVLAAIAYPSFRDAVLKARRADAMDGIMSIRLAQEKFRANCIQYATALDLDTASTSDTCVTPPDTEKYEIRHSGTSADDHYSLAIAAVAIDADTDKEYSVAYMITATAKKNQTKDSCGNFVLEVDSGSVEKYTSAYTDHTSYGAKRCWQR